jgi:hypothetical protein
METCGKGSTERAGHPDTMWWREALNVRRSASVVVVGGNLRPIITEVESN